MTLQSLQRAAGYAGLAKDVLEVRLSGSETTRARATKHLCNRMGRLRGLPQKLGQMLSFSAAADESGFAESFATLQDSADPLPWKTIYSLLQTEWDCNPDSILVDVDQHGHAASLGQVHRAVLADGREVAIKAQYPGIQQAIQTDMQALGLLSVPLGNLQRGFDFAAYRQVIGSDLQRELDYRIEADNQREFHQQWSKDKSIVVPRVVDELSSETVLVSDWEAGERWEEVRSTWSTAERRQLATILLNFFLRGVFQHGLMQADWHPGNLRFRRSAAGVQVVVYDFGCLCRLKREEQLALARLIEATIDASEPPLPLLLKLGFDANYLQPLNAKLPAVCRFLFEPFCRNQPYDLADWKLSERLSDVLGDDRWNFRIAGPATLIFLLRAFHGLKHYLMGLGIGVNWQAAFSDAVAPLRSLMAGFPVPQVKDAARFNGVAKDLKIRVIDGGLVKVQITQSASCIERLTELLDEDLLHRISAAGIDLAAIVRSIRQRAYAPGPVFQLSEGAKRVEVSLH